jgi:hypothetical protein
VSRLVRAALALAVAACGGDGVTVRPVYQQPVDDPDALATGLDTVELSVARAGDERALLSVSFAPGAEANLDDVPFADDLVIHLTGRIGATDVAYGRTCAFSLAPDAPPPTPHLWFARNVKFATTGIRPRARTGGQAITAADGSVYLIGGDPGAIAERFDPRAGALTNAAPLAPRVGAVAVGFGVGPAMRISVLGGRVEGGAASPTIEHLRLIDGATALELVDDPRVARVGLTATTQTDGRVVVIGGGPVGGDPVGAIAVMADVGGATEIRTATVTLATPRRDHAAIRLGDDVGAPVLVVGGVDALGAPVAVAELWKPLSGTLADPATFAPRLVVPRSRHLTRLMPDGSVLVIGGLDGDGQPVRTLERFTLDAGFVAVGELPVGAGVIDGTATPLPDGRILLAGGRPEAGAPAVEVAAIARLDVLNGAVDVVATDRLATPRAGHQAAVLCDGTVLVVGGTPAAGPAERYNPPPAGRR